MTPEADEYNLLITRSKVPDHYNSVLAGIIIYELVKTIKGAPPVDLS